MHRYLKSIGFSKYKTEQQIDRLLAGIEQRYFDTAKRYVDENGQMFLEIRAEVAPGLGICILGVLDEKSRRKIPFKRLTYYPYAIPEDVSSNVTAQLYHRVSDETLSGILEDSRVGVTLIFHVNNPFDYYQKVGDGNDPAATKTKFVGFSNNGRILLPNLKTGNTDKNPQNFSALKNEVSSNADINIDITTDITTDITAAVNGALKDPANVPATEPVSEPQNDSGNMMNVDIDFMEALKSGDRETIEQAAIAEMTSIAELGKRLQKEDIYSIIESIFMPQGIECDTYQIIGEIVDINYRVNNFTVEGIYDLTVNVNGLKLHVISGENDLEGEPDIGRRFKGTIWLQGDVQY